MTKHKLIPIVALALSGAQAGSALAVGEPVACRSSAGTVKAITLPGYHPIKTRFQFDNPNLEPLMGTQVSVTGTGMSCIVAHFSTHARITDNYIVFQVRVDGVPMEGHLGSYGTVATPVIETNLQDPAEQTTDLPRIVAYNFFKKVMPGTHTVEVLAAAGSNIAPGQEPSVGSPVLTLEYR